MPPRCLCSRFSIMRHTGEEIHLLLNIYKGTRTGSLIMSFKRVFVHASRFESPIRCRNVETICATVDG